MDNEFREKTESILKSLSLEEKVRMIHGCGLFRTGEIKNKGIPSLVFSDGPMGVRQEFPDASWTPVGNSDDYVSYCPSNTAIAASWNPQIAKTCGEVLGEEARARGKDVILAPGVNIQRTPLCGRNFEYMGEDPCLASAMAVPLIRGIQESDVAACVKHFALNSQETERLWVNVEADDRTLREIYLPAFRAAIKEGGAECIMGAYNLFRGKHCCENKELNDLILRKEWGFDGVYVSDWGAVHNTKEAAETSLDVEMSVTTDFNQYCLADPLLKEVREGRISEECIDRKAGHILKLMFRLKMIDAMWFESEGGRYASVIPCKDRKKGSCNTEDHRTAIRKASEESIVLLKNEGGLLPLCSEKMKRILVIGDNAERLHSDGGGSAEIKALYEISPLMGIKNRLGGNCLVEFARGYDSDRKRSIANWQQTSLESVNWDKAQEERDSVAQLQKMQYRLQLRKEAVLKTRDADAVIVIGGLNHDFDVEGKDRSDMELPYDQDQLIEEVLKERPDAVIVIKAGSPVSMDRWSGRAKAILWDWYGGMEDGRALSEIIFGDVNPSGKLPMSMPFRASLCPALILGDYPGRPLDEEEKQRMNAHLTETYREGIFVGYRYYEKFRIPVQFCFGHGLSYTEFTYSGLRIRLPEERSRGIFIYADIKNTGSVTGKETVQIYAGLKDAPDDFPVKELKAFRKVQLRPGESYTVAAELLPSAFSSWHTDESEFTVDEGKYCIYVGSSLDDIRLSAEVTVSREFFSCQYC